MASIEAAVAGGSIAEMARDPRLDAADWRAIIAGHTARLRDEFAAGLPIDEVLAVRTRMVDDLLTGLWQRFGLADTPHALLAGGGYGRGELHPRSDVDIAIVLAHAPDADTSQRITAFVTFVWDLKIEPRESVRTVEESVAAAADITVATNLLEARLITGCRDTAEALSAALSPERIWPAPEFFRAKLAEQRKRHARATSAYHRLEPNIKECVGGLRDIQSICWVANRHFGSSGLHDLVLHGFLTEPEYEILDAGRRFLWEVRGVLHFFTDAREDRLLFEHQKLVAARMGYPDDGTNAPVEQFMKRFYRTVRELSRLNEMLFGLLEEAILEGGTTAEVNVLNRRFQVRNGYIEARRPDVFQRTPTALLEIFLLMQQHAGIEGVRASTIRLIRENIHRIDQSYRADIRAQTLFMEIIRQPRRIGHELRRMHRYGVLERYLPAFGRVAGLMQFDLFHIHTVDEHSLAVVLEMRRLRSPQTPADAVAYCREIAERIPKLELLYIAGLFHDIAKGRGGDHSELGAQDAIYFCRQHGLSHFDTRLVAWLIRNHLLMSTTAQRKDISDPAVIRDFAETVQDVVQLDYLYLLTVADIRGTNPELWTSWKAALLRELYRHTSEALRQGIEDQPTRASRIPESQAAALQLMDAGRFPEADVRAFWNGMNEDYFYRHQPEEIAWQATSVLEHGLSVGPLVGLRNFENLGGTAVFIYCPDADYLFATIAQVLDRVGLTIQDARVTTTEGGYALDTFIVLEAESKRPVSGGQRSREITEALRQALRTGRLPQPRLFARLARRASHFNVPLEIEFSEDTRGSRTVVSVSAADRPGLLSAVGRAMQQCGVRLHNARISTLGVRVEDYFYISDFEDRPVDDPATRDCLESTIRRALEAA